MVSTFLDIASLIAPPLFNVESSNSARSLRLDKTLLKGFQNCNTVPKGTPNSWHFGFFISSTDHVLDFFISSTDHVLYFGKITPPPLINR